LSATPYMAAFGYAGYSSKSDLEKVLSASDKEMYKDKKLTKNNK